MRTTLRCESVRAMGDRTTVFYDGACPLCRREIAFYRRRRGAEAVLWRDVSQAKDVKAASGLSTSQALARFHVVRANGALVSGGDAFRALWQELPAFRPLAFLFSLPGLRRLLNMAYNSFLKMRPAILRLIAGAERSADPGERTRR